MNAIPAITAEHEPSVSAFGTASGGPLRLVLPSSLSANRYWRSFVPRHSTRAIVVVSDEAKAYRAEVVALARAADVRQPIDGRVRR